jgi:aspartyl-tRNA synthetase
VNPKLPTGEIEVFIRDMEVLGAARAICRCMVFGDQEYPEETRLRYRYLDLRREAMQRNMMLRSDVVASIRKRMWDRAFASTRRRSSPRLARGRARLPRALAPASGQVLRAAAGAAAVQAADHGVGLRQVFPDRALFPRRGPARRPLAHRFLPARHGDELRRAAGRVRHDRAGDAGVFEEFGGKGRRRCPRDWPQISYRDAALWYGTDKPDLRNPIKMQVVSEHFRGSGFAIFAKLLEQEGTEIRAIPAPGGGSRKFCDRMNAFAQKEGLPGMGYIFWREGRMGHGSRRPAGQEHRPRAHRGDPPAAGPGVGDAAFFLGGKPRAFEASRAARAT